MKGWKKMYYANSKQKKVRVAVLISDKTDFIVRPLKVEKKHEMCFLSLTPG